MEETFIPSAYSKIPMGGDVRKFIRSLKWLIGSVTIDCREDVSELFIDPVQIVDLDTPIRVCQLFGCYNVPFSVLNDQNAACSRTGYTPYHRGNSEMSCYQPAAELYSLFFSSFFFFAAAAAHPTR